MLEYALLQGATGPTPSVIQFRQPAGASPYPPTLDELAKSILPVENQIATAPNHPVRGAPFLILTIDGDRQIVIPQVNVTDKVLDSLAVLSVRDNLNVIKEDLGLSVTQMAELFDVTRKSVYDWYDGAEPRPGMAMRINALVEALSSAPTNINMKRLKTLWNVPVADRSFLAILNDEKLDVTNLRQALSDKLHQLSPRLANTIVPTIRTSAAIGAAHLAEFDREGDFS